MYIATSSSGGPYTLTSECLDISTLAAPALRFQYHMYGATMGTLSVEISTDTGATWTSVWALSGDQGNQWNGPERMSIGENTATEYKVCRVYWHDGLFDC